MQDAELLRRWAQGDKASGRRFVERYFASVYSFFRSKVERGAEDLTQQVFAACLADPGRYRGEGTVRAFVLGIARRTLLKHFRKAYREASALELAQMSVEQLSGSPSSLLHARSETALLHRCLARLPLDLQIVLELQYWEECSLDEIARIVDIPTGTVKSRLARARALLREHIQSTREQGRLVQSTLEHLDDWAVELRRVIQARESTGR